jgi:hypothetical protein
MTETQVNTSALAAKIRDHLSQRVQKGELSNKDMVSIIDCIGSYLNLKTISDYARDEKISYNGVLTRIENGKVTEYNLFDVKFVIDNE